MSAPDPWTALRAHTAARIALGRSGASLPTAEWLRFGVAHAMARDAVHEPLDVERLVDDLQRHGFADPVVIDSAAADRATYLRRPDLGRRLSAHSAELLPALARGGDAADAGVVIVIADGLSARAVQSHALPLLLELRPLLEAQSQPPRRIVIARQGRVAIGDEAAALLQASVVVVLIGERPGLSSPDSLGAYLTWAPRPGRADSQRNCVSNIRPEGLPPADAARKIAWLLAAARQLGATGIALKDLSDQPPLPARGSTSTAKSIDFHFGSGGT